MVLLASFVGFPTASTAVAASHLGTAPGLDVATLDARIEKAQARIDRWYPRIERWYRHIRRASAVVDRLEEAVAAGPVGTVRAGPLGSFRRRDPSMLLARARHTLRATLRSSWARHVQEELDAWSAYLAELVHARERALRPAPVVDEGSGPGSPSAAGPLDYEGWAAAFLGRLGAPACDENLLIVVTWETAESTAAAFNPLATTRDMPDAADMNAVGVKSYVSLSQGLDASRDTLVLGADSYGYAAILDALGSCRSAAVTARAINASAWCRGCVGGAYITGLLPIVRASYATHAARPVPTGP
ncbi:MAG TPA: hypothetical protein VF351_02200 [Actinomycetota bacterium]